MKAIRIHLHGGPERMSRDDLEKPVPGSGQALVQVKAAGVNFIDIYQRDGLYPVELPYTLGLEGAGIVESVAPGVKGLNAGDRVAFAGAAGSYAQYTVVPAEKLVIIPAELSYRQAAAAMLQGMTAHYLSHSTYPLKQGDSCLIHAAAGGVGLLLVQLAKLCGARVLATVSTEKKAELAGSAGADLVILYSRRDFEDEVREYTNGQGVNVVYDSVGESTFLKSLNCLKKRGTLVSFGQSSGKISNFDPSILGSKGSLYLTRPSIFDYIADRESLQARAVAIFNWIVSGQLRLNIYNAYQLSEAAQAHRDLASRKSSGKLILLP